MKEYRVRMPDGTIWGLPVAVIAQDRAEHYKHEYDGSLRRSLDEDTLPLFESDPYEVHDWAANNMNWSKVKEWAIMVVDHMPPAVDYEDGWCNGKWEVVAGAMVRGKLES